MSSIEVRLRVESQLKEDAENVFHSMGMTMPEAIRIFLKQSVNSEGLPFRPRLRKLNKLSLESFTEVEGGEFKEMSQEDFSKYLKSLDDENN